jgi:4'-phosphopantetheinyl transferase EntD
MIDTLLPETVVAVEAFDDTETASLFPGEEALVAGAVENRRREFATARRCARQALATLGRPPTAILSGPSREPLWPTGIVGSITHCAGYRAAVVARDTDLLTVGIDAEPHEPLPGGVLEAIALPREIAMLSALRHDERAICWDRLLFCAKEAVFKAWYPITGRWLDFSEADIELGPTGFVATLLVSGPRHGNRTLSTFTGRYAVGRGLVLAVIAVAHHEETVASVSVAPRRFRGGVPVRYGRALQLGPQRVE